MKIENTYTDKNGRLVAFDRVNGARIVCGMPAYTLWNGEVIEFVIHRDGCGWADSKNDVRIPVLNRYTGEVYGFVYKESDRREIRVNGRMREV